MILDEGNTEKSHGMAVAALQAAEEFLKESKKAGEAFNSTPPTSRFVWFYFTQLSIECVLFSTSLYLHN